MLDSAHQRSATLEHVAFYGGPGLGKTTLAAIIAAEQAAHFHELAVPSILLIGLENYSNEQREEIKAVALGGF